MEKATLSAYRYLTFLLPGGLVLFVVVYGWNGWPYGEPGVGSLLGLSVVAFMTGHVLAAIANLFQPVWWGHWPGHRLSSVEGLFGKAGRFSRSKDEVLTTFKNWYPDLPDFEAQFGIAYQQAQKGPLAAKLLSMVEEIGYNRSMATASALSSFIVLIFNGLGHRHLPIMPWLPIFVVTAAASAYRFRRFWRYVGEYVVQEVMGTSKQEGP